MIAHPALLLAALLSAASPGPSLQPAATRQGGLVRVVYAVPEGRQVSKAEVSFDGATTRCFQVGGQVVGLIGVAAGAKPGRHAVALRVAYDSGEPERFPLSLDVKTSPFPSQTINMPKSKSGLMSPQILQKEREILYAAMEGTAAKPLWDGPFVRPVPGAVTSPYGFKRFVHGKLWGQHGGLDLRAASGTPIHAANSGRILVAQKLWMRGNTVMIDHGIGLFSLYNHLSRIDVKPGQEVSKGEVIGRVGATGFVTGPHLHWEIRAWRTCINPSAAPRSSRRSAPAPPGAPETDPQAPAP